MVPVSIGLNQYQWRYELGQDGLFLQSESGRVERPESGQIQIQIQSNIYTLQVHLDEDRPFPDTVLHSPDIVVPQGVDLGHLTEAADHGQVNHRQNSLKILDPNRHNLGESKQGLDGLLEAVLGLEDGVVGPLLAGGDDLDEGGVRCAPAEPPDLPEVDLGKGVGQLGSGGL